MIKLPVLIIAFLPKKWQAKQIKLHWDSFSDKEILASYDDNTKWIKALNGLYGAKPSPIRDKFQKRLDELVLPQMKERNLIV